MGLRIPLFRGCLVWTLASLLQFVAAQGQNSATIAFEHYDHTNGLAAPVSVLAKDSIGFLWLGTTDGINRFDGVNFVTYRNIPGDSTSLANHIINDLTVDPQNRVWIATNGGMCYYDYSNDLFHQVAFNDTLEVLDRYRIHAVTNAFTGDEHEWSGIWFATKTILHLWHGDHRTEVYRLPALRDLTITYLYDDARGHLWIGTNNGLFVYGLTSERLMHTDLQTTFTRENNFNSTVHPIIPYQGDTLLVGSWYGGVQAVWLEADDLHSLVLEDPNETSARKHVIRGIARRPDGKFWVATFGNGLSVLDVGSREYTAHFHADPMDPEALGSEYINQVLVDRTGILWAGTGSGLDKYDPLTRQFMSLPIPKISEEFSVYRLPGSINEDRQHPGWLWVTVSGVGLFHIHPDNGTYQLYRNTQGVPSSLPNNTVYTTHYDKHNKLWVGSASGLASFDPENAVFTPVKCAGLPEQFSVHQIYEDKSGTLWLATFSQGLYAYHPSDQYVTPYVYQPDKQNGLPDNRVFCVTGDGAGNLWIGTQNRGVCRLDPRSGEFLHFEHNRNDLRTIPDNGVYDLYPDGNSLWIATENGLSVMDTKDFSIKHYTTNDGLCNADVFSITQDKQGKLWFATNNGISRFDPTAGTFRNYYVHDGLPENSISGAAFCGSDGRMYFGSGSMISFCQPESMDMNMVPPPVVITDFRIFDQRAPVNREGAQIAPIHLSYRDNMIIFDFAALNFTNAPFNQYAYRLEGFDDQWINCGHRQTATFTNLDGGTYTFHVRGANNDGIWNETGASVMIIVHPPFWRRWWFYVLLTVLISAVLYSLYRFRINQLMRLQKIRSRISRDLHDDVGSTLSSIAMISSMAMHAPPDERKATGLFETISTASRQAMDLMSDIVWSVNPANDKMAMIITRMRQYASETLEAAHVSLNLQIDERCNALVLTPEQRKNFYLVFKEAVNNIAKYAQARVVDIQIGRDQKSLMLRMTDDGMGFDHRTIRTGNGLKNMQARAEVLSGELQVITAPGHGTTVALRFPLSPKHGVVKKTM